MPPTNTAPTDESTSVLVQPARNTDNVAVQRPTQPPDKIEKKKSETIPETIPNNSKKELNEELFEPAKESPQADTQGTPTKTIPSAVQPYKKKGKIVGRQRKYEGIRIDKEGHTIRPIKELILHREHAGSHWPGMSKDMIDHYEYYYFVKPDKKKDKADYEHHRKCYERGRKWLADDAVTSTGANPTAPLMDTSTSNVTAFKKRGKVS